MAKETIKVDNSLEEIELVKNEKVEKKKDLKKDKKQKNKKQKTNKKGYFARLRAEIKPVTWPSRKMTLKYSFATIIMIIILAAFLIGISAIFDLLYSLVQGWIG